MDGNPPEENKRCGNEVLKMRTAKGLTRTQLIKRISDRLGYDHPLYDTVTEGWLARLEQGRLVRLPHELIITVCDALCCTLQERVNILISGGRNVFSPEEEPSELEKMLAYVMAELGVSGNIVLGGLLKNRPAASLSTDEMMLMVATTLKVLIERR